MRTRITSALASALIVTACATPVSPERIAAANYGPPPPPNYEEIVKARFNEILIDPTAPLYQIDKPRKGYTKKSAMYDTQESFGWVVCGRVNSKNRMGGYTGWFPFFALFRGGYIAEFIPGEAANTSLVNSSIRSACSRQVS